MQPSRQLRLKQVFFLLLTANLLTGAILFAFFPGLRPEFIEEDRAVENLSAAAYGLACVGGLLAFARGRRRGDTPLLSLLLPGLAFLAFLDETSFLGLLSGRDNPYSSDCAHAPESSPLWLWGYPVDGLHDILNVIFKLWRDHTGVAGYAIGSVLLGAAVALAVVKRRAYMPHVMAFIRQYPPFDYLRFAVILVGIAMIFDLDVIPGDWGRFAEEILELNGGFALAFGALSLALPARELPPRADAT